MLCCPPSTMNTVHEFWNSLQRGVDNVTRWIHNRQRCQVDATKVQQRMQQSVDAAKTMGTRTLGCFRNTMGEDTVSSDAVQH